MNPKISILMPVYNCEPFIAESVSSVLAQTFVDFELLLIDDASRDRTADIVQKIPDPRIRVISIDTHAGIANALNLGLAEARGAYIARMDGDDVCRPDRLERQFNYMEKYPETLLCGTNMRLLGSDRTVSLPTDHESIRAHLLFSNCISHPTVLIRRHSFLYSTAYPHAEDYALWAEMIETGKFYNLSDFLYDWRIHDRQISTVEHAVARASGKQIHRALLSRFGVVFSEAELDLHTNFQAHIGEAALSAWLDKLLEHNEVYSYYDQSELASVIDNIRKSDYVLI